MPYDASKDPHASTSTRVSSMTNGSRASIVTPSNDTDLASYAKAIVLLTAGNVAYLPAENADGVTLAFVDLPAGWVSPHRVRRVLVTGTTATVATVDL